MPPVERAQKFNPDGTSHGQGSWFAIADSKNRGSKIPRSRFDGSGKSFQTGMARFGSKSNARKAACAMIAKIPFALSSHIARCYKPMNKPCGICEGWGTYRGTECQQCSGAGVLA